MTKENVSPTCAHGYALLLMMNQLHQKLVFAQDLFHTSENAMDVHRVIQLAFKETVFDMNKSPAVNEMRRVGSQGEPVAACQAFR